MKRSLVFLATACALCVAWVLCKGMQADTRTVEIEGEAIPYICQNEKVYVYLKDLLDSGFFVDAAESRTLETRSGMVSEIVLWQEDIYPNEDKKKAISHMCRMDGNMKHISMVCRLALMPARENCWLMRKS